ncbi:hypothetical protein [Nonomuraea helvata]|uniref:Uncharacterized protein n=1 Tax=Nonomuraea helvata TaxID=37484 RepID=A0ABV5S315_9ACTN
MALATLFSLLSIGTYPAAAASARLVANPAVTPESLGTTFGNDFFPRTDAGAAAAQAAVRDHCGDNVCVITVQASTNRFEVMWLGGCTTWHLYNFWGYFHAKNGGSLRVDFLNSARQTIGSFKGGKFDVVYWDPIYYIRTCNR